MMKWAIAAAVLAVSVLWAGLWAWMAQRQRTKGRVSVPFGEDFGLIAYRQGGSLPRIIIRREGFFGTRVGGEWIGLIAHSEDAPGHYAVYWSATKLAYKHRDDLLNLRPSGSDHHAVCADVDEGLEEVVRAEQNHVRNLKRLHEAQRRLRGHS